LKGAFFNGSIKNQTELVQLFRQVQPVAGHSHERKGVLLVMPWPLPLAFASDGDWAANAVEVIS
jgi:hypothetical protein